MALREKHTKNKDTSLGRKIALEAAFCLDLELLKIIYESNAWRQSIRRCAHY